MKKLGGSPALLEHPTSTNKAFIGGPLDSESQPRPKQKFHAYYSQQGTLCGIAHQASTHRPSYARENIPLEYMKLALLRSKFRRLEIWSGLEEERSCFDLAR